MIAKSRATSVAFSAAVGSSIVMIRNCSDNALAISDQLPVPHTQIADTLTQGHIKPELAEDLRRAAFDFAPVHQAYSSGRFTTEKDILGDGKLWDQVEFLGNGADTCLLCLHRAGKSDFVAG